MKSVPTLCVAAIALAVSGCQPKTTVSAPSDVKTVPATTAEVARKDVTGYVFFDGKVYLPDGTQGEVVSPYDVPISDVYVREGDRVGRGAPIAKMDLPGADESLSMAKASYESARTTYNQSLSANNAPVQEAERMLKEARTAESAAKADVLNGGSSDVAAATAERIAAEQNLKMARSEVDNTVRAERQALNSAEAYWKEARAGSREGMLKSPISGTVVRIDAKPGVKATARQSIASIIDLSQIQIQGTVPPAHADEVKKGSKILIALDGPNSDPFEGEVTDYSVLPPADGQTSAGYLAVIKFDNSKGKVRPGMNIKRLGLRTGKVENAMVIPVGAVSKNDAGKMVTFVKSGTEWVERIIEIGLSDGALTEVKSGLKEGDVVRVNAQTIST